MLIDKGHHTVVGTPMEISRLYKELNGFEVVTEADRKTSLENISVDAHFENKDDQELLFKFDVTFERVIEDPVLLSPFIRIVENYYIGGFLMKKLQEHQYIC